MPAGQGWRAFDAKTRANAVLQSASSYQKCREDRHAGEVRVKRAQILRRLALGWLVCALVLTPVLGLVHQVVHGDRTVAGLNIPEDGNGSFLAALFAGHHASDCHLLDQHTHAGPVVFTATLDLPTPPCALLRPQSVHAAPTRWFSFFEARAPPHVRA